MIYQEILELLIQIYSRHDDVSDVVKNTIHNMFSKNVWIDFSTCSRRIQDNCNTTEKITDFEAKKIQIPINNSFAMQMFQC